MAKVVSGGEGQPSVFDAAVFEPEAEMGPRDKRPRMTELVVSTPGLIRHEAQQAADVDHQHEEHRA